MTPDTQCERRTEDDLWMPRHCERSLHDMPCVDCQDCGRIQRADGTVAVCHCRAVPVVSKHDGSV